jgi:hypothetical protein
MIHFRQQKIIGKKMAAIIRYACAVGSTIATIFCAAVLAISCIMGVRGHTSSGLLIVLPLFGFLTGLTSYLSWGFWQESFPKSTGEIIAELQTLSFHSLKFYDVATGYFLARLRSIRNSGLAFICFAAICLAIINASGGNWQSTVGKFVLGLFCFMVGWAPFTIGKYGIRMIITARNADTECRLNTLRQLASGRTFRGDPIGAFISQQFDDEDQ